LTTFTAYENVIGTVFEKAHPLQDICTEVVCTVTLLHLLVFMCLFWQLHKRLWCQVFTYLCSFKNTV